MFESDVERRPEGGVERVERSDSRFAWRASLAFLGVCLAGGLLLMLPPVQDALIVAAQVLADSMSAVAAICR